MIWGKRYESCRRLRIFQTVYDRPGVCPLDRKTGKGKSDNSKGMDDASVLSDLAVICSFLGIYGDQNDGIAVYDPLGDSVCRSGTLSAGGKISPEGISEKENFLYDYQ